jgi:hypothetical protein
MLISFLGIVTEVDAYSKYFKMSTNMMQIRSLMCAPSHNVVVHKVLTFLLRLIGWEVVIISKMRRVRSVFFLCYIVFIGDIGREVGHLGKVCVKWRTSKGCWRACRCQRAWGTLM